VYIAEVDLWIKAGSTSDMNPALTDSVVCQGRRFELGIPLSQLKRLRSRDFLIRSLVMERNLDDDSMYLGRKGQHVLIIALYVDELLIACDEIWPFRNETKRQMSGCFKMKDLGESQIIL